MYAFIFFVLFFRKQVFGGLWSTESIEFLAKRVYTISAIVQKEENEAEE